MIKRIARWLGWLPPEASPHRTVRPTTRSMTNIGFKPLAPRSGEPALPDQLIGARAGARKERKR